MDARKGTLMSSIPMLNLNEAIKKEIAEQIMVRGVTPEDARLATDLAIHAVNEAGEAISRVSGTAPMHLRLYVLDVACQLIAIATGQGQHS